MVSDVKQQSLYLKGGRLNHSLAWISISEVSDHSLTIEPASLKHTPFYGMTGTHMLQEKPLEIN